VSLGEQIDKDMIAVPIGPDMRQAIVASPAYFARHPRPKTPRDLTQHQCINLRLSMARGFYSWVFAKAGRELRVRVEGPLAFNTIDLILRAALDGFGLAYLPEGRADSRNPAEFWHRDYSPLSCGIEETQLGPRAAGSRQASDRALDDQAASSRCSDNGLSMIAGEIR
jgi:DNA-binding transcriptional LysR family regulator